MNDVFHVGEIATYMNFVVRTEYNGVECEIIGGLEMRMASLSEWGLPPFKCMSYLTRASDGRIFVVVPHRLRKKRPPSTYDGSNVGRWDDCPWQPERVTA